MPENIKQDVKTQSHRIISPAATAKKFLFLAGFVRNLLKYNGCQIATAENMEIFPHSDSTSNIP